MNSIQKMSLFIVLGVASTAVFGSEINVAIELQTIDQQWGDELSSSLNSLVNSDDLPSIEFVENRGSNIQVTQDKTEEWVPRKIGRLIRYEEYSQTESYKQLQAKYENFNSLANGSELINDQNRKYRKRNAPVKHSQATVFVGGVYSGKSVKVQEEMMMRRSKRLLELAKKIELDKSKKQKQK